MKLDYIVLPTENVNEVREWYNKHLDLGIDWESADFVLMTGDDGARLGIHRVPSPSEPEHVHLHFEVDDVDDTYEELLEMGVRFSSPPENTNWGYRSVVCQDPASHTVEIFQPTHS